MFDYKRLIEKSIKSKTLTTDVFGYSLILAGFGDKYLAGQLTMYKSYNWLYKRFKKYLGKSEIVESQSTKKRYVWMCWLQGIENAPKVVKDCYNSIQYWLNDRQITVITAENFGEYVTFPDYIIEKWEKGIISNALFSDLLRIELLIKYGGLWLDATTYLTGPIPQYVEYNDFFVYRNGWMNMEMINMGSWFIYSGKTNNMILIETRELLYKYLAKYNYIKNYFLMHMFFRMVTDIYKDLWNKVPYFNQIDQHLLMNELGKKFNVERIEEILKLSSIHKLTYKLEMSDKIDLTINKLESLYINK